jgi:hypothetical protein
MRVEEGEANDLGIVGGDFYSTIDDAVTKPPNGPPLQDVGPEIVFAPLHRPASFPPLPYNAVDMGVSAVLSSPPGAPASSARADVGRPFWG